MPSSLAGPATDLERLTGADMGKGSAIGLFFRLGCGVPFCQMGVEVHRASIRPGAQFCPTRQRSQRFQNLY